MELRRTSARLSTPSFYDPFPRHELVPDRRRHEEGSERPDSRVLNHTFER